MALGGAPHYGPQLQLEGTQRELLRFRYGQYDHILLTDSALVEWPTNGGPWFMIRCVLDGSGVVGLESSRFRTDEWTEITMNAGDVLYGCFTAVQVAMASAVVVYTGPYWVWPS